MKIDRSVFLALATSIAAVACTAAGEESEAGNDAFSLRDGGADADAAADASASCWHPTSDLASGAERTAAAKSLGFDPVADYPSAEGFCIDLAAGADGYGDPSSIEFASKASLTDKCYSYAKLYQPHAAFFAFQYLKAAQADAGHLTTDEGWDTVYALDRALVADATVCTTDKAKAACSSTSDKQCITYASQLTYAAQTKLTACLKTFDVYTCAEGGLN